MAGAVEGTGWPGAVDSPGQWSKAAPGDWRSSAPSIPAVLRRTVWICHVCPRYLVRRKPRGWSPQPYCNN